MTSIKSVTTDVIKIGLPAIVAAVATYKATRGHIDLERVRVHEKERMEANRKLFMFARKLSAKTFPLAQRKEQAFLTIMRQSYFGKLEDVSLYLSDESLALLDELENQFTCMTDPDLIPEMDPGEQSKFFEQGLYDSANKLVVLARKATRMNSRSMPNLSVKGACLRQAPYLKRYAF